MTAHLISFIFRNIHMPREYVLMIKLDIVFRVLKYFSDSNQICMETSQGEGRNLARKPRRQVSCVEGQSINAKYR